MACNTRDLCILIQLQIRAPAVKMGVFRPSWGDRFTVGKAISHIHGRGSPKLAESMGHCMVYCKTHKSQNACTAILLSCLWSCLVFLLC